MNPLFYFLFALGFFIMSTKSAQAYLDPGSGSLLFQIIVGGVLSGLFAIKLYYRKIKLFFKNKKSNKQENIEHNDPAKN
ncbi:MAG: hypothetical protein WCV69_03675 [Patescibacteria group bacterium]|jgi:hypothetical protein